MSTGLGTWGLRLLALVLALLVWGVVTFEQHEPESVKVINTTIRYDSPRGFILLDPEENARVTLRGKASSLRNLNPFQIDVNVELPGAEKGTYEIPLGRDNVFLPEDIELISIEPTVLSLVLDREVTRMLPVTPRLVGEPAAGAIAQAPVVIPPRVPVRGPESRISALAALSTTPITLDTHAIDFEERAIAIAEDPSITIITPVVTVRIPLLMPGAGEGGSR
jgi:YbbR domain-containing protein